MTRLFIIFILILSPIISLADVMRVTILGSGTPRPDIERFSQAILIEAEKTNFFLIQAEEHQ